MNRALTLVRLAKPFSSTLRTQTRNSQHYVGYRELNYEPNRKIQKVAAEFSAGVFYWWIGWNLMTDWRHLIGEFVLPERREWTDEELGVA